MSDLKIRLTAEIDPSSISNMAKQLKGIQEGVGKIKIDIDTNEVMSRLGQLESKMKPMDLKIDTAKTKTALMDVNGQMEKFHTTSVQTMRGADGAANKYVTTMMNADRTLKQVTTEAKDMSGNFVKVGSTITQSLNHPLKEAQVEATRLNKTLDLGDKLNKISRDFENIVPKSAIKDVDDMIKSLDISSSTFDTDVKNIERSIKTLGTEAKNTSEDMKKALDFENKTGKLSSDLQKLSRDFEGVVDPKDIAEMEQMIALLNPNSTMLPQELTKIRDRMTEVRQESSHAKKEMDGMAKSTGGLGKMMGGMLKRAVGWVSLTMVVRKTFREIKEGVAIVKEVDSAMVELKRVTNATQQEYASFMNTSFELGKQLGKSGTDVINATADFSRMGFDMKEASDLAQEALLMTNVGDGVDNVEQASTAIITALKGFKVESEDSVEAARHINDAYNEVANNFAIDTENIAEGVRRSSALMAASGNDINQTIGLVTGGFEVMQDSSKVSSGLNIIAQRLKGINDEGKDSPELVAKLKNEFKDIANTDLELPNGELKNTYTILEELAGVYPDLSSKQRAYLAELAAGKRQSVVLESIMSNWENVAKATQTATDAAGSAMEENEKYMDSIEGKLGILEAAKEQFWSTLINTDSVKGLVDAGITIVDTLSDIVGGFKDVDDNKDYLNIDETIMGHGESIKYLEDIQKEFGYLNTLVGESGDLSAMSEEQKSRYLEIVGELQDAYPQLETFYNSQGELVASTRTEIEKLIKAKKDEIKLDKEKSGKGLDKRINKHKKENSDRDTELGILEKRLSTQEKIAANEDKYNEEQRKNAQITVDEIKNQIEQVTYNTKDSIDETMKYLSPQISLLGDDIDALEPHVDNITNGIRSMLETDSSDSGIDKAVEATKVLEGVYKNIQQTIDSGGVLPDSDALRNSIGELTDLGMSYNDVATDLYATILTANRGEEAVSAVNAIMADGGTITKDTMEGMGKHFEGTEKYFKNMEGGIDGYLKRVKEGSQQIDLEFLKSVATTDEVAAAYMASLIKMDDGIEEFKKSSQKNLDKIKLDPSSVVKPEEVDIQFKEVEKSSASMLSNIEKDAKEQREMARWLYEDLGVYSEDHYNEEINKINQNSEKRKSDLEENVRVQKESISEIGKGIREGLLEAKREMDRGTRDISDIWGEMDEETKKFLVDVEGIDGETKKGLEDLEKYFNEEGSIKEFQVVEKGMQFVKDNIEELGEKWDALSGDDKEFLYKAIGEGIEDSDSFQKNWDELDPAVKVFLAEQAGLEDVQNADYETMQSWAKEPLVKLFMAQQDGLEGVRIERSKTDGVWEVTIGDVTYRTLEEGGDATRTSIQKTLDLWRPIPRVDTKKTIFESVFKTIGAPPKVAPNSVVRRENNWTGNESFKGGLSFVGEKGRELLLYPDGSHDMTGQKAELRNLPRGTIIYNNQDTEDILKGKKMPEFNRGDNRVLGKSNTPKFSEGNKKARDIRAGKETHRFAKGNAKAENRAVADIYEKVNRQLEKQGNLIKRNNLLQERAEGNLAKQIVLLKEQLQLNKDEEKLLKNKQSLQRKERNDLERHLSKAGFKFKGKGDDRQISNLGNISGKNKSVEEKFNQFNDLSFNLIPSLNADILSIQNDIANSVSKGFEKQTRLNNEVLKNNHLLSMNAIYRERAVGDTKETIKLIKDEIKLQTQKEKLQKDQSDIHRAERAELEKVLKKEGFKFEGKGDFQFVTNENHVKGKLKEVQEALDKYNDIQLEVIPSIKVDREQIKNSLDKLQSEIISATFDGDDVKVAEFDRRTARSLENNKIVQRKNDPHWDIVSNQRALEAMEEKRSFQYNKGWEYINKAEKLDPAKDREDIKKLNDKAQEYFKDSRDAQLEIFELKTKVHEGQMKYIDEELNVNSKAQDELKFQMEILDDDNLAGKLDLTSKIAAKELESYTTIKSNVKELEAQLKVTSYNSDEWHVINDSLEKYNQLLKDSTLELKKQKDELVKIAQAQADKQFDADLSTAEKSIFGGQTEKDAKQVLDDKIEAFEDYISGEEKALEIAQIRKMVEEEGLTLTREQQNLLNQGGQVERDKLDRLNKQLNIQQLQAKLENQKNQKNIKQLVKKDDGTFDFEYVADKKAIKETENALLDSKKDLANWELKNSLDKDKKIFEEKQKLLAVEEERLQARLKAEKEAIGAHYQAIMERQIAMMEMNMALMEQLNSEKSIKGWSETIEGIMPLMDELGINFAELMEELGIDLTDNFDIIMPLLYDMGLLHEDMVGEMGIDFEKYMDAVIPVLDELGIDHEEFLAFMGVDLNRFLKDANMTFAQYSETVRKKNAETKADVDRTKEALRVPTESTHTVKLIAPPPFSMPNSSSTHTIHTVHTSSGGSSSEKGMAKFDTGGKTPAFSGGRIAMLHEKEIVLNKSQSATFEKLIDIMPNMVNTFNDIAGKFKGVAPKIPKVPTATNNSHSEETVQNFNINKLEFPNVKSADEIEKAILKLPMLAKQRVRPV